ncbi:unnamed protein product [Prunus armeniaca]
MLSDKEEAVLKLEGMESGSTRGSVVNHVVIQSDASNVPNTVKLNGSNYPLWSKVLEMHIAGRGKKGFVTGSIKEPNEDSADYDAWETENAIVKRWLINSMDPNIMGFFIHLRTAQEVWEEVARKYYDGSDISQIYELKRRPIKMECARDLKTLRGEVQLDCVYAFLAGLNDIFDKELKKKLRAKERASSRASLRHPPMGAATTRNKDVVPTQGDPSWILDSGATDHMTFDKRSFKYMTTAHQKCVATANGTTAVVTGAGTVDLTPSLSLHHCLLVPLLLHHLLSIPQVTEQLDCVVLMYPFFCLLQDIQTKEIIRRGTKREGLYYVDDVVPGRANAVQASRTSHLQEVWLLHCRLGHVSFSYLRHMLPSKFHEINESDLHCEVCILAKSHRASFPSSKNKSLLPFELVHLDVWGPSPVNIVLGVKWFVTFIDDCTRMKWVYLLKNKSNVSAIIRSFSQMVAVQYSSVIKVLRTDNRGEYVNSELSNFFRDQGIFCETTCSCTPQQNEVVDMKNRHILETARAMLIDGSVPKSFWLDVISYVVYVINRMPSRVVEFRTPLQVLTEHVPIVSTNTLTPRVFGCYKCYHPATHRIYITMDVTFSEYEYFYTPISPPFDHKGESSNCDLDGVLEWLVVQEETSSGGGLTEPTPSIPQLLIEEETASPCIGAAKGKCSGHQPTITEASSPLSSSTMSSSNASSLDIPEVLSKRKIPTRVEDALKSREWTKAMDEEMRALQKNNTWEVVELQKGKKPVGCRWVFTVKYKADGSLDRYKARLVVKGYTQTYRADYQETFSPVAKMNAVRVLISLAVNLNWPLKQFDVKNAFLHGYLEEEVYMDFPIGYSNGGKMGVCRLRKSLYGLKQSPRAWFGRLTQAMRKNGYYQSHSDHTLFVKRRNGKVTALIIYVDDVIITGDDSDEIVKLEKNLSIEFEMKSLGDFKYFLGVEVAR